MRDSCGMSWRDRGQRYGLCCPNNEEYREFVKAQIREMFKFFDNLDGIFYDMPYWEIVCHCDACKARWAKEVGGTLPDFEDFTDPKWLKFVSKRQEWMGEFAHFVRTASLAIMPDVTVELNFAAVVGCNWLAGSTETINEASEFTGGDLYGDLYNHSFTCKYYYGITKNQPFEYMTCRCDKNLREHTVTKSQLMLEAEIMLTVAHHGASLIIDAIDPLGTLDERVYDRVGKVFDKQIPYEQYMNRGKLYSEVAVYFDSKTQFSEKQVGICNKQAAVNAVRTLTENHIPVSVVANKNMRDIGKYPMVIAPVLQDFDNDDVLKLIDYVKNGGTLYLSGKSDSRLISKFFGGEITGYTYGDSPHEHVFKGYAEVQAYLSPEKGVEFGEFTEKYPMPITYKLPVMRAQRGEVVAKIVLPYTDPDDCANYASIHSNPPYRKTGLPAILHATYGKGKVIWSAAVIEYDLRKSFQDVFIGMVRKYIPMRFRIDASKYVEAVVFKELNEYYISLVDLNADNETLRRGFKISVDRPVVKACNLSEKIPLKEDCSGTFERFEMIELVLFET